MLWRAGSTLRPSSQWHDWRTAQGKETRSVHPAVTACRSSTASTCQQRLMQHAQHAQHDTHLVHLAAIVCQQLGDLTELATHSVLQTKHANSRGHMSEPCT